LERLAHGRKPEVSANLRFKFDLGGQKGNEKTYTEKLWKASGDKIKKRGRKKARRTKSSQNIG